MIAKVKYQEIMYMRPEEAAWFLKDLQKFSVNEAKLIDVLNPECFQKPLADAYHYEISPKGVYLFYTAKDEIRYVGQTNQSFFHRLLTQLDIAHYPGFGWNSMLTIMSCNRLQKPHAQITEDDHEVDLKEVLTYKLLLIDAGYGKELNGGQIKALEKVLMKAYREIDGKLLLNNRVGKLYPWEWDKSIDELIKNK